MALSSAWQTGHKPSSSKVLPIPIKFDRIEFERRNNNLISKRWTEFLSESAPFASQAARLWASGRLRRDDESLAENLRETLTNLGPTFVKLGQILSVREDVLGKVWATELAKLQDDVRPFSGKEALAVVRDAFGGEFGATVSEEPVAAASLAQVHRGKWRREDGTVVEVAVKVLRPGVRERVSADLCVLLRAGDLLAGWAPRVLPVSRVDWQALLEGLVCGLWEECDLSGEAERQTKFAENMRSVPRVFVPGVIASTENVMVSEWVDGVPLRAISPMDNRLKEAQALMRDAYCQSMFVDAFFHADCHGGNLLWVPGNNSTKGNTSGANSSDRLCILDCGLMVAIDSSSAEGLLRLSLHLAARDWTRVVESAIDLKFLPRDLNEGDVIKARGVARRILGPYLDVGGGAKAASAYSASSLFRDISSAALDLPTSLPPDMVLLGRAVIQLEGLALRAYPDYRLVDDILPVATRIALRTTPTSQHDTDIAGSRKSLLFDLLYDDVSKVSTYRGAADSITSSFALEKLRALLSTARSASSPSGGSRTSTIEDLIDELLQAGAIRDLIAQETGNIVDAVVRDAMWKGTDSLLEVIPTFLPKPPTRLLESLAPRLSRDEQLVLLRLPEILRQVTNESSNSTVTSVPGTGNNSQGVFFRDITAVKLASIPGFGKGLRNFFDQALVSKDPNARAAVDAIREKLQNKLRTRLEETGVPSDVARILVDTSFLTPW